VRHSGSPQRLDWPNNFISTKSIDKLEYFVPHASFSYGGAFAAAGQGGWFWVRWYHCNQSGTIGACDTVRGRPLFLDLDANADQWIATNPDRRWALLLEYWNGLAQRLGRLPKRTEVDPLELPGGLLPNIFLVDVVRAANAPELRFRFRLLGAAISERETVRPGQYLDDYRGDTPAEMTRQYVDCLERRVSVRRTNLAWDHPTKEFITYHVMLLPLSNNGVEVDTLLGLAVYEA